MKSSLGDPISVGQAPRFQIDARYGVLSTDVQTFTGSGGTATAAGGLFTCATTTTVGSYAVIRSRRQFRVLGGQAGRARFSAVFPVPGVALSQQFAGAFNAMDGYFLGYLGTQFGLLHRYGGQAAIYRLTVTAGTGGVGETATVTLNGVAFTVALSSGLSTTQVALALAQSTAYTGWVSPVSPKENGTTVTFIQGTPGATAGAFTLTSTGAATGTFAALVTGVANNESSGWVSQRAWNADNLTGEGDGRNPSGYTLDPTKISDWQIEYGLGSSPKVVSWLSPDGEWVVVHRFRFANASATPSGTLPFFRVGLVAASLGSSTALQVKSSYASAFVDGEVDTPRGPFSASVVNYSASASETVALVIRNRGEFSSQINLREVEPLLIIAGTETNARVIYLRIVRDPTFSAAPTFSYVSQSLSAVEQATPSATTATGGRETISLQFSSGASTSEVLSNLGIRLEPGEVMAFCLRTANGTAVCNVSINWSEY